MTLLRHIASVICLLACMSCEGTDVVVFDVSACVVPGWVRAMEGDHECGNTCGQVDGPDWCSCEVCPVFANTPVSLPPGAYTATVDFGASGVVEVGVSVYDTFANIELARFTGPVEGLGEVRLQFELSGACSFVEIRIEQNTSLCLRSYGTVFQIE